MSNRNRNKGHDLERAIAKVLRKIGFLKCKTSRQASKLLDDCGVDIAFVPLLIQAKAGYSKKKPNYYKLEEETREKLKDNYPEDSVLHDYPFVLVHKPDRVNYDNCLWHFKQKDILPILKFYYDNQ
jgi:hypothetical protein